MTTAEVAAPLEKLIGNAKVIDVDTHFTEPPDLWTSRAPAAYKDKVPHMKTVDGQSQWFVEGDNRWLSVGVGVMDREGKKDRGKLTLASLEEMNEAVYKVKPRVKLWIAWASMPKSCTRMRAASGPSPS